MRRDRKSQGQTLHESLFSLKIYSISILVIHLIHYFCIISCTVLPTVYILHISLVHILPNFHHQSLLPLRGQSPNHEPMRRSCLRSPTPHWPNGRSAPLWTIYNLHDGRPVGRGGDEFDAHRSIEGGVSFSSSSGLLQSSESTRSEFDESR